MTDNGKFGDDPCPGTSAPKQPDMGLGRFLILIVIAAAIVGAVLFAIDRFL